MATRYSNSLSQKVTNAPLVTFRLLFGALMVVSILRFWINGWIYDLYIAPKLYFPFIEGLKPVPGDGMYVVFGAMLLAATMIMVGAYYRVATTAFFLLFTYVELLDKTNYLNHYYFVSLLSFLLIFIPAHKDFSWDVRFGRTKPTAEAPRIFIQVLRLQMAILYVFAGIAKINSDWLLRAQPMKMWLAANVYQPVIGELFRYKLTAYIFSWFGMVYDTTIPFWLSWKKSRVPAYVTVVIFHLMTWWLFPIGMFPFIMIAITTVFFSPESHQRVLQQFKNWTRWQAPLPKSNAAVSPAIKWLFIGYFAVQFLLPMRYLAYPGDLFWTEEGYRFSWRVMLMEKAGQASFYVKDKGQEKAFLVPNYEYLTQQQEKMMATQPDMIVQYAHMLEEIYKAKGLTDPVITAEVYVTLNGRPNRQFIDPKVDLTEVRNDWRHKTWISRYD
ncbi:HTTM domain-containing protein [Marinoscillum furvescens]|uniref:HTTM domain-containing protein n=1 Tax=Marinoscillum furvescens TaxID=1026 RepID=UPI001FE7DBDC|nr:HTTM domain-containing protein [Marinoscillum furvescens]